MKDFTRKVLVAIAPVLGTFISIAILVAAHFPFPPALSWEALPQWAVFVSVTYTCNALCIFILDSVFREAKIAINNIAARAYSHWPRFIKHYIN
jgi:hypothetical protein